jgi:CheY-like chemotaxis protein
MVRLRILIADDHDVVRHGVRSLLEQRTGWHVCGEAANGREAVQMARQLKPDVAVLDFTMPELSGLEATQQILKSLPRTEIIILSINESEEIVREVLDAGARGYPRFQYGGFSFSVVDPWPEYWSNDWYNNDDMYIDYSGGGYYLHNRMYPQDRIAIAVSSS